MNHIMQILQPITAGWNPQPVINHKAGVVLAVGSTHVAKAVLEVYL